MALQIWFPFTKDTKNYGLCGDLGVSVTPTLVDNGKLGKALSTGQFYLTADQTNKILNNNYFTICFWIYIDQDTDTSKGYTLFGNDSMTPPNNRRFTVYHYNTVNKLHLSWQNYDSSGVTVGYISGSDFMPSYEWTHVAVTYNSDKREVIIYKNGQQHYKISNAGLFTNPDYNYATTVITNSSGRYLNDYRVYDNCLSPKEIYEISKGLFVHYPLNDLNIESTTNIVGSSKYWSGGGTWGGHTYAASNTTFSEDDPVPVKVGTKFDLTYSTASSSGGGGCCRLVSPSVSGNTTYTYSIYIKASDNFAYTNANFLYRYEYNGSTYVTEQGIFNTTRLIKLHNGWYRAWGTFTTNASTNSVQLYFYSYPYKNVTYYLANCQLEQKDHMTPYTESSRDETVIYDASGYERNGVKLQMEASNNSAGRYKNCAKSPASPTQGLFRGVVNMPAMNNLSITWWANYSVWGVQYSGLMSTSNLDSGPYDYQATPFNHRDQYFDMTNTAGTVGRLYAMFTIDNKWHFYTLTYDGSTAKWYVDSTQQTSVSLAGPLKPFNYLYPFWSYAGSANRVCQGMCSDIRMFATTLSVDDIKSMYQKAATIDNLSNMYTYEYIETEDTLIDVKKTGVTNASNIVEPDSVSNVRFKKTGEIESNNFYEI